MSREKWLEEQLDRDDLTEEEFQLYNREANEIQARRERRIQDHAKKQLELEKKNREEKAIERLKSLSDEDVDIMYAKAYEKYAGDINGMSFQEWFEQAQKFYHIDGNFVVHSTARSPKPENTDSVPCFSLAHARYRVLTLILTKLNDHGNRGYDFRWIHGQEEV